MTGKPIKAIAVHEEIEAWLLCDADALRAAIGPLEDKDPIPHNKDPDGTDNPKKAIKKLFSRGRGKEYNEGYSPGAVAKNLKSVTRLRKSQSFVRFEKHVLSLCKPVKGKK
jgi:hypothetical protein